MKRISVIFLMLWLGIMIGTSAADTLWYNGDLNNVGYSLSNRHEYLDFGGGSFFSSDAIVYDNFIVPKEGWTVDSVWSNNLFTSGVTITGATWEIRSSMSAGNGGTVVQSGLAMPQVTATGRTSGAYTEYQVLISGLDFNLAPGTYWLSVTPTKVYGDNYSYNSATGGANALGNPIGDNGNSYWYVFEHYGNGSTYSQNYVSPYYATDFSMGVGGASSVPLPASLPLLGSGLALLIAARRRWQR